ncbi:hypothetical protein AA984_14975 [Brevibacillus formosus]|uniref:Uncharacterized protein n=1 Tax=Brevibacillus formosus TaxID=54913 RepID=A0A837KKR1_9BACL|nr:hypothetical protein AA984_14975 [Brevibacillus formosus]
MLLVAAEKGENARASLAPCMGVIPARLREKRETASKVVLSGSMFRGGRLKACFPFSTAPRLVSQRASLISPFSL